MSTSESPFDRLGESVDVHREPRRVRLHGTETIFSMAHHHAGDWRRWRRLFEVNDLSDPLDLANHRHDNAPSFISSEDEDITDDTGIHLELLAATPELRGYATISVEDIDDGVFDVRLTAPADDTAGPAVAVKEQEFFDGDDPVERRITLRSAGDRHTLFLGVDINALLVIWVMRDATVRIDAQRRNTHITVPKRELGAGRGEV